MAPSVVPSAGVLPEHPAIASIARPVSAAAPWMPFVVRWRRGAVVVVFIDLPSPCACLTHACRHRLSGPHHSRRVPARPLKRTPGAAPGRPAEPVVLGAQPVAGSGPRRGRRGWAGRRGGVGRPGQVGLGARWCSGRTRRLRGRGCVGRDDRAGVARVGSARVSAALESRPGTAPWVPRGAARPGPAGQPRTAGQLISRAVGSVRTKSRGTGISSRTTNQPPSVRTVIEPPYFSAVYRMLLRP